MLGVVGNIAAGGDRWIIYGDVGFEEVGVDDFVSGMSQRPPPDVLHFPSMIMVLFLITSNCSFFKITVHPSSHNCPNETKLECKCLKIAVFFPSWVSCLDGSGRLVLVLECI